MPQRRTDFIRVTDVTPLSVTDRFWVKAAICFVTIVVAWGSNANPHTVSLTILNTVAALFAAFGLVGLRRRRLYQNSATLTLAALFILALPLAQLIPLPSIPESIAIGHRLGTTPDLVASITWNWKPISIAPSATASALFGAAIPMAAVMLGHNVPQKHQWYLVSAFVLLGLISGCFGLGRAQGLIAATANDTRIASAGSLYGLFIDRDHHVIFLGCMIVLAPLTFRIFQNGKYPQGCPGNERLKSGILVLSCLIPFSLAALTGSRTGVATTLIAMICLPLVIESEENATNSLAYISKIIHFSARCLMVLACIGSATAFSLWIVHAPALDRFFEADPALKGGVQTLPDKLNFIWHYWPFGSGAGSFEKAYLDLYMPGHKGILHTSIEHIDAFEVLVTGGLTGLILILSAISLWLTLAFRVFIIDRPDEAQPLRKAGLIIIALLAIASLTHSPMHTPSIAALFCFAWTWASSPLHRSLAR